MWLNLIGARFSAYGRLRSARKQRSITGGRMNKAIVLGAAVFGGVIAFRSLSTARRRRLGSAVSHRMFRHMERMMSRLPDSSPPKLVRSVLPRLREQNDQIIAMLKEQNALLRKHLQGPD